MSRTTVVLIAFAIACVPAAADAPKQAVAEARGDVETRLLDPLVGSRTWTGTTHRPGQDAVKSTSTTTCRRVAADTWLVCDLRGESPAPGQPAFEATLTLGYDRYAKEYRAFLATLQGIAVPLAGKADGKKVIVESTVDVVTPRGKTRLRLSWDFTDPKRIRHLDERALNGAAFAIFDDITSP